MKKLLLTIVVAAVAAGSAMAQGYEKNLFGVRAGLNVSNVSTNYFAPKSKAGFHVAGVYQRLLTESLPLYLETGLQITQKGCKFNYGDSETDKYNAAYLEIPVMVNYKFNIRDIVTLYPSVGLYYAFGVGGKNVYKYDGVKEKYDLFGEEGSFNRSDFGMRFSGTVDWKHYSFGLGYEFGFMNVAKSGEYSEFDGEKIHTGNFFISVGYNF